MKAKLSGLMAGVAVAAMFAGPALAGGDVIYTGYKDPAAAVAVPAPIPVETYDPEYYWRLDLGFSWLGGGTVDEIGTPGEVRNAGEIELFNSGGIGIGRYITPSIRAELSVDLYTVGELNNNDPSVYVDQASGPTPGAPGATDTRFYSVTRDERISYEQDVGLFSLYYDIKNHSRFTPYLGAGIGLAYRQVTRTTTESGTCRDTVSTDPVQDVSYNPNNHCNGHPSLEREYTRTQTITDKGWDLAAAFMAGFAFEIHDNILWDNGYRLLWSSGASEIKFPAISGTSTLDISDTINHEFRTGIRVNLN
jgi:opacity protein-like surface antigen